MEFQANISSIYCVLLLCLLHIGFANAGKLKQKKLKTNRKDDSSQQPNIIFIFADDLGYADVGFNGRQYGSKIQTPNLDRLAKSGVILSNYYVQNICTPTRSQLMTGRYQIHTGLVHSNVVPIRPMCLPEDEITLPQKLKEAGYSTHMVGKWHLGHQRKECLPTYRGFDSFVGMYLGSGDYFTHRKGFSYTPPGSPTRFLNGYDFHKDSRQNRTVGYKYYGEYSTHVFSQRAKNIVKTHRSKTKKPLFLYLSFQAPHGPLQVPSRYKLPFDNTNMKFERKTLAAMIYCMDQAIGDLVDELKRAKMYSNTVIIFSSDNGGPDDLPASNWPFRGTKGTFFEGGVHGVGFIHSPLVRRSVRGTVSKAFIHVSDWFPTIVQGIAGGSLNGTKPLDGFNIWKNIKTGRKSPRTELLFNINPVDDHDQGNQFLPNMRSALRMGDWKIITGCHGRSSTGFHGEHRWKAPPESNYSDIVQTESPDKNIWLFNITADPYEFNDLSDRYPAVVNIMLNRLQEYMDNMSTPIWPKKDLFYDPADYGGVWGPWVISPPELLISARRQAFKAERKKKQEIQEEERTETLKEEAKEKKVEDNEKKEKAKEKKKKEKAKEKKKKQKAKDKKKTGKAKETKEKGQTKETTERGKAKDTKINGKLKENAKKEKAKEKAKKEKAKEKRKRQKAKKLAEKKKKNRRKIEASRIEAMQLAPDMIHAKHALKVQEKLQILRKTKNTRNKKLKQQRAELTRNTRP